MIDLAFYSNHTPAHMRFSPGGIRSGKIFVITRTITGTFVTFIAVVAGHRVTGLRGCELLRGKVWHTSRGCEAQQTEVRIENCEFRIRNGARELGSPFSILNSLFAIRTLVFCRERLLGCAWKTA